MNMAEKVIRGVPASEGIALGPAYLYQPMEFTIPTREADSPEAEMARFTAALEQAHQELEGVQETILARTGSEEEAAIFEAHAVMLDDPMLEQGVRERVETGLIVEQSLQETIDELANMLSSMDDELFAARAADVRDVGRRLLRILLGIPTFSLSGMSQPAIIVAHDLSPSDTASLQPELALGFCTEAGGLTSHTAILARTLGIPAVVGLGVGFMEKVQDDLRLAMDGETGEVILDPEQTTRLRFEAKRRQRLSWLQIVQQEAHSPATTSEGDRVDVGANVGDIQSARAALEYGAEGVGLLRTEFLYLEDIQPPNEEKQYEAYRAIFALFEKKPVIVRTLDIGGDKPPSYMEFEPELNPFLGWRAIRISLEQLPMFRTQLRAILRAAVGHNVLIMFPMISGLDELQRAKEVLVEEQEKLEQEAIPHAGSLPVGIMVETPAAAVLGDVLAQHCDFFSIGTNDLTQYALAVDRTNERIADLYQPLHPAVLRLIQASIDDAHRHGIWVGMCGELAGMQKAIPLLLGMGLDEFSMTPRAIPEAKWLLRQLKQSEMRQLVSEVMAMGTASQIEDFMSQFLAQFKSEQPGS
jgi:phosphoenolpyruvate-protein phosphotransferase